MLQKSFLFIGFHFVPFCVFFCFVPKICEFDPIRSSNPPEVFGSPSGKTSKVFRKPLTRKGLVQANLFPMERISSSSLQSWAFCLATVSHGRSCMAGPSSSTSTSSWSAPLGTRAIRIIIWYCSPKSRSRSPLSLSTSER